MDNDEAAERFAGLVRLAQWCEASGVALLAFDTGPETSAVDPAAFLAARGARFPAVHLYHWRLGLLGSTLGELRIRIGDTWSTPLVAVRDREGRVVAQTEGVSDWDAVLAQVRSAAR